MCQFQAALAVMTELFSVDCHFALATVNGNRPSVRMVDAFFGDGAFFIVTHIGSAKVNEIEANERVSLCSGAHRFDGTARNIGHPLAPQNDAVRDKLAQAFEWYSKYIDEKAATLCFVKIDPEQGFFHKDGIGYKVDFTNQTAETFPVRI